MSATAELGAAIITRSMAGPQSDLEGPENLGTQASNDAAVGGIAADRLRSLIERIERLEEEWRSLAADIKDIYAEAKGAGFEPKVIRTILQQRRQQPADVEEQESLLDIYRRALGM